MPGYVGLFLFIQLSAGLGLIFSSPAPMDSSAVHFNKPERGVARSVPEIAPCPDGQDFCEDPEDYPRVITRFASYTNQNVFNASVALRTGFVQESRACDVRKSTIYPRKAKDLSGTFKFILNSDEYIQSMDIEQCIGEGSLCRVDSDAPTAGSTFCRQKYAKYQMLAIDKDGNDIVDFFRLPSACICHHVRGNSNGADIADILGLRFNVQISEPILPICTGKGLTAGEEEKSQEFKFPQSGETSEDENQSNDESKIYFNDETPTETHRSYRHSSLKLHRRRQSRSLTAPGCFGSKYCEGSQSYPAQLIENIVETESKIPSRIMNKFIKRACVEKSDLIVTRQFNINEEQLCQGSRRIIVPKEAQNIKNEWKFIVNSANYTQTVDVEECVRHGNRRDGIETDDEKLKDFGTCLYSGIEGHNPSQTSCRQLYREHKLLVVTQKGELEIDKFSLPSACACFLRTEFNTLEFRNAQ